MKSEKILKHAHLESDRFQLRVFRGSVEELNAKLLLSQLLTNTVDVAILRLPANKQADLTELDRYGIPYLVADTLVYYYTDLLTYQPRTLTNTDLHFVKCEPNLITILDNLVDVLFKGYTNHYNTNSLLDKSDIVEGYKEWARNYINDSGRIVWLVKRQEDYIGFATCSFSDDRRECEGILYGVLPNAAGGGVYGDIIKFTQQYFKNLGYSTMKVSTQVQNYAVQKVWAREGFFMKESFLTLHINSLFENSIWASEKCEIRLPISLPLLAELADQYFTLHSGIVASPRKCSYVKLREGDYQNKYYATITSPIVRDDDTLCRLLVTIREQVKNEVYGFAYFDYIGTRMASVKICTN